MKKIGSIFLLVLILGCIGAFFLMPQRSVVAFETHVAMGEVFVVTKTDARIWGWETTLCWRRLGGPWMLYYLDHESSRWRDVDIAIDSSRITVTREGKVVATIDTKNGSCERLLVRDARPFGLLFNEKPFPDASKIVYPESPRWPEEWPAALRASNGLR
jgi:hypothetical protein